MWAVPSYVTALPNAKMLRNAGCPRCDTSWPLQGQQPNLRGVSPVLVHKEPLLGGHQDEVGGFQQRRRIQY